MNSSFECAFCAEYRKRQRFFCWKFLGLLLLGVAALMLLKIHWLQGGVWRLIDLGLPGIILLCCLHFIAQNWVFQRWMARRFKFTSHGIVVQKRQGKEEVIPWTSVITVDTGTLSGYENQSVSVIRCFLSSTAWEKFTPNLRQSVDETAMRSYYKLRKECFVIEHSPEREQTILSFRAKAGRDERDSSLEEANGHWPTDEEYQNAFSDDISVFDSAFVFMNYFLGILGVVGLLASWIFDENDGTKLRNLLLIAGFILALLYIINSGRKATHLLKSQVKICKDGVYVKYLKQKEKKILWSSIIEIEHRKMIVGRENNVQVICCFQSLSSQSQLNLAPKQGGQGQDLQLYYNLRDEVVTMSYTKERMAKIRAFHRAATKKK